MSEGISEFLQPLDDDSGSDVDQIPKSDKKTAKRRHKALLDDVGKLSGKKKKKGLKKNLTSEPSQDVSEFHWTSGRGKDNKVQVEDLVGCLENTSATSTLKKSLEPLESKVPILDAPLPKHELEQVQRTIVFQQTAERVSKWAPTVHKNRNSETLSFPLNNYTPPETSAKGLATSFKPRTSLEEEIAAVLNKAKPLLERNDKELSKYEEDALKTFDLQEAMERRKELQKMRALQSYYEAKCKRIRKIKSKKFHRIQRKAEAKQATADLEQLAVTNPELLKSETEKAEALRALERANLRHRNTSKWAKNLIIKGKSKSAKDREAITEQLRLSRALTDQKTGDADDNDDEAENRLLTLQDGGQADNPWLLNSKTEEATENEAVSEKFVRLKPVINFEVSKDVDLGSEDDAIDSTEEWDKPMAKTQLKKEKTKKRSKKKTTKRKDASENLESLDSDHEYDGLDKNDDDEQPNEKPKVNPLQPQKSKPIKQGKALRAQMNTELVNVAMDSEDEDDIANIDDDQVMTIREAFANDDVISEFINEKKATIEKDNPKDIDSVLPGWGEWVGKDLKVSKKKKRQFTIKAKPRGPRKDDNMANVIINEERNKKFAKKQVSGVPFPFNNGEQFERSIRQPIGPNWNTPNAMSKMTQPRIERLMGTIIEPIKITKSVKQGKAAD